MEIGNLPETKFKIMLVKMIQNIEKTREDPKNVYQNLEKLKNKQMNNTQEEINNRNITEKSPNCWSLNNTGIINSWVKEGVSRDLKSTWKTN